MTTKTKMTPWVLVVDDDQDNRELLAELLESEGYETIVCANAAEADRVLDDHRAPCLVIADVHLPDRDGVRFAADMRKRSNLADTPVIFVTGLHPSALKGVEDAVLTKPFEMSALVKLVARHCGDPPRQVVPAAV